MIVHPVFVSAQSFVCKTRVDEIEIITIVITISITMNMMYSPLSSETTSSLYVPYMVFDTR